MKLTVNALEQVLEVLIKKYPDRLPVEDNKNISRLIGQQDVISFLHAQIEVVGSKNK